MLGHAWLVTALNPKSITFFVAFVPQFVNRTAPFAPQAVIMVATFVVLAFANAFGYAFIATRARKPSQIRAPSNCSTEPAAPC